MQRVLPSAAPPQPCAGVLAHKVVVQERLREDIVLHHADFMAACVSDMQRTFTARKLALSVMLFVVGWHQRDTVRDSLRAKCQRWRFAMQVGACGCARWLLQQLAAGRSMPSRTSTCS